MGVSKHYVMTDPNNDRRYVDYQIPVRLMDYVNGHRGDAQLRDRVRQIVEQKVGWRKKIKEVWPLVKPVMHHLQLVEYMVYPKKKRLACEFRQHVSNLRLFQPKKMVKKKNNPTQVDWLDAPLPPPIPNNFLVGLANAHPLDRPDNVQGRPFSLHELRLIDQMTRQYREQRLPDPAMRARENMRWHIREQENLRQERDGLRVP